MGVARVPRLRIVTALLAALILVSIVPLALLHFNLIGINRDALETAEKKYLKNSSVTLAENFDTSITNAQSQLRKIADGIRLASSMSHGSLLLPVQEAAPEGVRRRRIELPRPQAPARSGRRRLGS